jgi:predicted O-methyltransferase YrrM
MLSKIAKNKSINKQNKLIAEQERLLDIIKTQEKYVNDLRHELSLVKLWIQPGHFYSPITNDTSFKHNDAIDGIYGIDMKKETQNKLAQKLSNHLKNHPYTDNITSSSRYYFNNDQFGYFDALYLYSMLLECKPKRIIEVGSGFSSAIMLDVNNSHFNNNMKLTFIEPYPKRLNSLLRKNEKATIIEKPVQNVSMDVFKTLRAGDMLFIDSSHVSKSGSDVNWLFFEVLPVIAKGVIIHIHDVFYPFEYPDEWIRQGRSWTEDHLLRALLTDSDKYSIKLWPNYLHRFESKIISKYFDREINLNTGSIWIEKD